MKFTDFAARELGLTLTKGQRVLSLVAFDGLEPRDLDGEDREIARRIFGDVDEVPPLARRVLVLLLGRVSGKTLLAAAFAVYVMVTADLTACGPGDLPVALVVAPTKRLAALAVRAGLDLTRRSPRLRERIERETSEGFQLRRRDGRLVAFEAVAASRGGAAGRGVTILLAVLDEAEFFLSDDGGTYAVNDRDVYGAIAPRARLTIFISTPWPVPTLMGELIDQNWANPTTALAAKAPTLVMRDDDPSIAMIVAAEEARDAANAAREFHVDTTSVTGAGIFIDPFALSACVDHDRPLAVAAPRGAHVRAGGDLSATRDPSTLAVVGVLLGAAQRPTHVQLLELLERRPEPGSPLKMSETIAAFAEVLGRHGCKSFVADAWGREAAREFAAPHKIRIGAAPEGREGKVQSYLALRKLITEGRITLPPHPRLLAQLRSVTSRPAPGGSLIITSPRRAGAHGDLVSALVLAVHQVARVERAPAVLPPPIERPSAGGEVISGRAFFREGGDGTTDLPDLAALLARGIKK